MAPHQPRRTSLASGDGQLEFKLEDTTLATKFTFSSQWDQSPFEPMLVVLTHEDAHGKIYGSEHFMLKKSDLDINDPNEASSIYTDSDILNNLMPEHIENFCELMYNNNEISWSLDSSSPSHAVQGVFHFIKDQENSVDEVIIPLNALKNKKVAKGALSMCDNLAVYTLKISSPETASIGSTYGVNAFKFDASTMSIKVSNTQAYISTVDGHPQNEEVEFKLCVSYGRNADSCITVYTLNYINDESSFSLISFSDSPITDLDAPTSDDIVQVDCSSSITTTAITLKDPSNQQGKTYPFKFGSSKQVISFDESYEFEANDASKCTIDHYKLTCTDPQGDIYIQQDGRVNEGTNSTRCAKFIVDIENETRTITVDEAQYGTSFLEQIKHEGTYFIKIEPVHSSGQVYDQSLSFMINVQAKHYRRFLSSTPQTYGIGVDTAMDSEQLPSLYSNQGGGNVILRSNLQQPSDLDEQFSFFKLVDYSGGTKVQASVTRNSQIVTYDQDSGEISCDLSVLGRQTCVVNYTVISVSSSIETIEYTGTFQFNTECDTIDMTSAWSRPKAYRDSLKTTRRDDRYNEEKEQWEQIVVDDASGGYEIRQPAKTFELPYFNYQLPSKTEAGGGENYLVEVCGRMTYTVKIDSVRTNNREDYESFAYAFGKSYSDFYWNQVWESNHTDAIEITRYPTTSVRSADVTVETDDQYYALDNFIVTLGRPIPYTNEMDYHFIISVAFDQYPVKTSSYNDNKEDVFVIYDWCAHLWYEGEPKIQKSQSDNFIYENPPYDYADPGFFKGKYTPIGGVQPEDPWVFKIQTNLNSGLSIFEMSHVDYRKFNPTEATLHNDYVNVGCTAPGSTTNLTYTRYEESWNKTESWVPGNNLIFVPPGGGGRETGQQIWIQADKRFMIGTHNMTFRVGPSPAYVPIVQDFRYIRFEITILDCELESLSPGIQEFWSQIIPLGNELIMPFQEYVQTPSCNFDVEYTITLLDLAQTTEKQQVMNSTLENLEGIQINSDINNFVSLDRKSGELTFAPVDDILLRKQYAVFITGHVKINETIQPDIEQVWNDGFYYFEPVWNDDYYYFEVEIDFAEKLVNNTAPKIRNMRNRLLAIADEEEATTYVLGSPYDLEGDQFYLEEWGLSNDVIQENELPDWISFQNSTVLSSIRFIMEPTSDDLGQSYLMYVKLTDLNKSDPKSEIYKFEVIVSGKVEEEDLQKYIIAKNDAVKEQVEEKEVINVEIEQPNAEGYFWIKFDKDIRVPATLPKWKSDNEGANAINLVYEPSEETLDSMEEQDLYVSMYWSVVEVNQKQSRRLENQKDEENESIQAIETDKFRIKIDFTEPQLVSKGDKDTVSIEIKYELFSLENQFGSKKFTGDISEGESGLLTTHKLETPQVEGLADDVATIVENLENFLVAFLSANLVFTVFSAYALQYLWGLINTLQIIVLSSLFGLDIPINAKLVMQAILKMCSLEAVKFDFFFDLFDFRETNPFMSVIKNGEEMSDYANAGYDSANFFLLLGPIVPLILIFILSIPLKMLFKRLTKNCGENCCTRRVRTEKVYMIVVLRFFLESCLEIGLSGLIVVQTMGKENFETFWEAISTSFAFIGLACLFLAPIINFRISQKYLKEIKASKVRESSQYDQVFENLRTNTTSLLYSSIFFVRRYCVILAMTIFPNSRLIQIGIHGASTMFVVAYLAKTRPYVSSFVNKQELLNELIVWIAIYPLLVFTDFVPEEYRLETGWFIVALIGLSILINLTVVLVAMLKQLKQWIQRKWIIYKKKKNHARVIVEAKEQQKKQAKYIQGIFSSGDQKPAQTTQKTNHLIEAKFQKSQSSQPSQLSEPSQQNLEKIEEESDSSSQQNSEQKEESDSSSQQNSEQREESKNSSQLVLSDESEDEDVNDDKSSKLDQISNIDSTAPAAKLPLKPCGIEKIDRARIEKLYEQGRFEEASELVIAVTKLANNNILDNQLILRKAAKEKSLSTFNVMAKTNKKPKKRTKANHSRKPAAKTEDLIGVAQAATLTAKQQQGKSEPNAVSNAPPPHNSDVLIKEYEDLMKELNKRNNSKPTGSHRDADLLL